MFTFIERDDGYLAEHENGRGVAHIDTRLLGETNDPNLKVQKKTLKKLLPDQWRLQFTGYRITPPELAELLNQLVTLSDNRKGDDQFLAI